MSQASDDRLQFSINESVWLRNDAPAKEILSMALEPDITVEENVNDVTIKGFLRLTGEYIPDNSSVSDNQEIPAPFRTIEEIMETDTGTAVLEHRFPLDITIPVERVPNLEELFLVIDSFDYELTGQRHMQLQADIAITGLADPVRKEKALKKAQPPVAPPQPAPPAAPSEKKKEVKKPAEKPAAVPKAEKAAPKKEAAAPKAEKAAPKKEAAAPKAEKAAPKKAASAPKAEKAAPKKEAAAPKAEKAAAKKEAALKADKTQLKSEKENPAPAMKVDHLSVQPAENPLKAAKKAMPQPVEKASKAGKGKRTEDDYQDVLLSGEYEEMPTDSQYEDGDGTLAAFSYQTMRRPELIEEEEVPHVAFSERTEAVLPQAAPGEQTEPEAILPEEKETSGESSNYLTKVLAGDEAEQRTQVRLCIVQTGDSLESISERYHVPVTSLLRKNELTTAHIEPGEILYIPKAARSGKNE
ncbi:LysM peptidoglycan-binding domain-containing protein [Sporolactobacillus sp. THM19-2]|uniref:LysM peptidoglycan-binding domain-containing protein n=1 Tax=Sporolactobacillus sp. THM19-2 TaxID=2511171 RepID=UPI00101FC20A|nr:LysM peptidoglycan-binding domain-containing protein [Sporolactobacillus sp. THM19-2]RYL94673.1 LysM peptidoglycan-binding domain-containing protein [Sporolactobacillus sp. THM19-2]